MAIFFRENSHATSVWLILRTKRYYNFQQNVLQLLQRNDRAAHFHHLLHFCSFVLTWPTDVARLILRDALGLFGARVKCQHTLLN